MNEEKQAVQNDVMQSKETFKKLYRLMGRTVLMICLLLLLSRCHQQSKPKNRKIIKYNSSASYKEVTNKTIYDSSVVLFNDTGYKLNLHFVDKKSIDENKFNTILTVVKSAGGEGIPLLKDSLYVKNGGYMEFEDFNSDRVKDLLIFFNDGARANPRYHLYIIDRESHELKRIKGFENLPNPEFDTTNNVITSEALSGTDYYSFYRITAKNKLINLGHSFEVSERYPNNQSFTEKYESAIKKIKRENRIN